jgi:periplasmic protein CpxP/Spy
MKKITIAILMVGMLTIGLFGFALAQKRGGHHGGFGHGAILGKIANELGLSAEQKEQIKQIVADAKTRIKPLAEQLKAGHDTAKTLGTDGAFNEEAVNQLANSQSQLMKQMIIEKEKTKAQVFGVLNAEQRTKAQELMKNFEGKMRGRFGGKFGHDQEKEF